MKPISVFMDLLARGPKSEIPDVLEREDGRVVIKRVSDHDGRSMVLEG